MEALQIHFPTMLGIAVLFFTMHWFLDSLVYKPIVSSRIERNNVLIEKFAEAQLKVEAAKKWKAQLEQERKSVLIAAREDYEVAVAQAESEAEKILSQAQKESEEKVLAGIAELNKQKEAFEAGFDKKSEELGNNFFKKIISESITNKKSIASINKKAGIS